ncbi:MAG: DUF1190 domain-containing protein [Pseudomonadales bacterium]|nr:DUF1190 domain-containing protein [Pseudomonadales bacterium]
MKRTKKIDLNRMRKSNAGFVLKPAALGIAAASLVGCGNSNEAYIYKSVDECVADHASKWRQCDTAYSQALSKARRDGKRFDEREKCETVYGDNSCERHSNYYTPMMMGFMFSPYHSRGYYPLYSSSYRHSPYYGRWGTLDGDYYPRSTTSTSTGKSKSSRKVTLTKKTMSRGGFGSTVSAKSSWGGSSSRGGWGG